MATALVDQTKVEQIHGPIHAVGGKYVEITLDIGGNNNTSFSIDDVDAVSGKLVLATVQVLTDDVMLTQAVARDGQVFFRFHNFNSDPVNGTTGKLAYILMYGGPVSLGED